ncbi:MAG TPA: DoxX family protein [Bacteroidia bacterium]|nr:DoxX family protein [Bacteroidia bacterium]HNT80608.1 DoxX family protein [Bacteroidia bacterium]
MKILKWLARIIAALIMLQTLFFKFSSAEESVYIFTKIGMEPWGRYGSGIAELIASILLLIPKYTLRGALIGAMVMIGAIASHLGPLGIEVLNDEGYLFTLACIVFLCCIILIYLERKDFKSLFKLKP